MLEEMLQAAKKVRGNAYAPYSKFLVGVCIKTPDNQLFSGCNVENASYGITQCAEGSAIGAMVSAGHKRIAEVVVVGTGDLFCSPCGMCRQRIREFASLDTPIHMFDGAGNQKTMTLEELLPESFGPENLQ